MRDVTLIYKIATTAQWQAAQASGAFAGAPIDLADGFIHFSTAAQTVETASKHFRGLDDLLLLAVDADALGAALRYEASRGGDLFPHLYDSLPLSAVRSAAPIPMLADGTHDFTGLLSSEDAGS